MRIFWSFMFAASLSCLFIRVGQLPREAYFFPFMLVFIGSLLSYLEEEMTPMKKPESKKWWESEK